MYHLTEKYEPWGAEAVVVLVVYLLKMHLFHKMLKHFTMRTSAVNCHSITNALM